MLSFSSDALTDCFVVSAQTLMIGLCGDLFSSPCCHQTHYNWKEAFIIHVVTVLLQVSCESVLLMGIKSRVGSWVGIPGKKLNVCPDVKLNFLIWSKKSLHASALLTKPKTIRVAVFTHDLQMLLFVF